SFARIGSYAADTSPGWAHALYAHGWQPPLWLAAGATAASFAAALVYRVFDGRGRAAGRLPAALAPERITWSDLVSFDLSYWYILALNVLFAAVFFPFRSTFAIEYFQDAKGLTLQQAGLANSWVFFAAIFATPLFGFLADRLGRRSLMMTIATLLMPLVFLILGTTDWSLWISTALMGISFSVVPAVIWPATAMLVEPRRLGTALGLINLLQNLLLAVSNLAAGWLSDRAHAGPTNPSGYDAMLWYFGLVSLVAFVSVALLWRRESGPRGHGLEGGDASRQADGAIRAGAAGGAGPYSCAAQSEHGREAASSGSGSGDHRPGRDRRRRGRASPHPARLERPGRHRQVGRPDRHRLHRACLRLLLHDESRQDVGLHHPLQSRILREPRALQPGRRPRSRPGRRRRAHGRAEAQGGIRQGLRCTRTSDLDRPCQRALSAARRARDPGCALGS